VKILYKSAQSTHATPPSPSLIVPLFTAPVFTAVLGKRL